MYQYNNTFVNMKIKKVCTYAYLLCKKYTLNNILQYNNN